MDKERQLADELAGEYPVALRRYLQQGGEAELQRGYELGRRGLGEGVGVLTMVAIHHQALADVLAESNGSKALRNRAIKSAAIFFTESMSPFEMTHRSFGEANAALRRMNENMEGQIKRIAHALHDEAGQLLAAVHLSLDQTARQFPGVDRSFREVKGLLDEVAEQIRRLSHELRPTILDDLGLTAALDFLAEGVSKRSGIHIAVRSTVPGRLPGTLETVLYRVVQEALNNVMRHSQAKQVTIRLRNVGKSVLCSIVDDGVGFEQEKLQKATVRRGLGLLGMIEKLQPLGGDIKIDSSPGHGTKLSITVPREVDYAYSGSHRG